MAINKKNIQVKPRANIQLIRGPLTGGTEDRTDGSRFVAGYFCVAHTAVASAADRLDRISIQRRRCGRIDFGRFYSWDNF